MMRAIFVLLLLSISLPAPAQQPVIKLSQNLTLTGGMRPFANAGNGATYLADYGTMQYAHNGRTLTVAGDLYNGHLGMTYHAGWAATRSLDIGTSFVTSDCTAIRYVRDSKKRIVAELVPAHAQTQSLSIGLHLSPVTRLVIGASNSTHYQMVNCSLSSVRRNWFWRLDYANQLRTVNGQTWILSVGRGIH